MFETRSLEVWSNQVIGKDDESVERSATESKVRNKVGHLIIISKRNIYNRFGELITRIEDRFNNQRLHNKKTPLVHRSPIATDSIICVISLLMCCFLRLWFCLPKNIIHSREKMLFTKVRHISTSSHFRPFEGNMRSSWPR